MRVVEAREDFDLAFADDAAARLDPGVYARPDCERTVPDREAEEVGDEQRVEHPARPPLMVQKSAHKDDDLASAGLGREPFDDVEQRRDD